MRNLRRHPGYGRGEHRIEADLLPPPIATIRTAVHEAFSNPTYQPPMLPSSALEVRRLSTKGSLDLADVVAVLEWDPMLAASAMRVAQSLAPAGSPPPPTLQSTIDRLGLGNVSHLAFETVFKSSVFGASAYTEALERVRAHSVATAKVARMIARGTPVEDYAFTCGLLHDIGMVAVIFVLAKEKIEVGPAPLADLFGQFHEEAGGIVVDGWGLSADLRRGILDHHRPTSREGALVRVADAIASECGLGSNPPGVEPPNDRRSLLAACRILNLDHDGYARIQETARVQLAVE